MDQRRRARVLGALLLTTLAGLSALGFFGRFGILQPADALAAQPPPDSACIGCHGDRTDMMTLPSGEEMPLGVDLVALDQSVHGMHSGEEVYCTDCHSGARRYRFPHEPDPAETLQEFSADVSQNCQRCHEPIELHNPGHLMAEDKEGLPTCSDCHGGHEAEPVDAMQADPVGTCLSCHETYEDERVAETHAELVANLGPNQTCQTCHTDTHVYPADAQCKSCHTLLTSEITMLSGDTLPLNVDLETLENSVHGFHLTEEYEYSQLLCTDCHSDTEQYEFPHPTKTLTGLRSYHFENEGMCRDCHTDIYESERDGVHAEAYASGLADAATCFDCHGNHDIQMPAEPRERVSQTCSKCHSTINEQYAHSVHGAALLGEDNPDVPVCTDCHGVHHIEDPTTAQFRLQSPEMCAECHADEEMMGKYGISTDVFDTYVADFHGTTVELFEKQSPDQETNKAVCYDCHGVHNILPASDENSQVIRQNLLVTCQQCHPDAEANFPDAWTSHFKPSLQHNTLVYLVDLFYAIVIPITIGFFTLLIGSDIYRTTRKRRARKEEGDHGEQQ